MSNFTKSQIKTANAIIVDTINGSKDPYDAQNRLMVLSNMCKGHGASINLPKKVKIYLANLIDMKIHGVIDAARNA